MKHGRRLIAILAGCWFGCCAAGSMAGEKQPSSDEIRFFESRIRPILANRCFKCHGPDKQKSDLRLDSAAAVRKGGASGEALFVPGQADKSFLIKVVLQEEDVPKMPPKEKLSSQEIADLARWARMGGFFPIHDTATEQRQQHWAFQTPGNPAVPSVEDARWPRSPVDRFIMVQLEARGLRPAPPADRRTLIRRATFDLIGLPPTPREVDVFLADDSPQAFARVLDRLLASPHYGERWGRHWLDVVRYADSNGLDENVAHGNAWRYRDHVVDAFNKDKPYDQFLLDQIAGDLVGGGAARNDRLIATGFLALGPKVLAEPDDKKMEMDIIDEQIDTLGRSIMGLTMGCARCHDHKFDPFTLEDYYALAGIFRSTRSMESFKKVARWYENPLAGTEEVARKTAHDQRVLKQKKAIQDLIQAADTHLNNPGGPGPVRAKNAESRYPEETRVELKRLRDELARLQETAPELPSAMGVADGPITDATVLLRGNHLTPGKPVPRRFPVVLAGTNQPPLAMGSSGRLELAHWLVRPDHPLTSRVMVNRIWRWHFGQGLVATTDNFGRQGGMPANQPLLDWLAHVFADGGWSIKAMHRLIMLTSTYQMSSAHDSKAAEADPDNRLHWRTGVRRLEAEEIRDALLAVSGALDLAMGGSLLHVKNRAYLFNHTSRDKTEYDSPRRSVYLPVIRNNLYDVFQLFDTTDATVINGDRATTTVATQALFMMNSDLVARSAERLAASLLARQDLDDDGRVHLLYLQAYGRPPTPQEVIRARRALEQFESFYLSHDAEAGKHKLQVWAWQCQVILAASEFVYVN